jgi:hypothetical protein
MISAESDDEETEKEKENEDVAMTSDSGAVGDRFTVFCICRIDICGRVLRSNPLCVFPFKMQGSLYNMTYE